MYPQSKVVKLMFNDPPDWILELIKNIFSSVEVKAIIGIPLSLIDRDDMQTLRFNRNGLHSIRSAYHLYKQLKVRDSISSS